jgi:hypothetical protein
MGETTMTTTKRIEAKLDKLTHKVDAAIAELRSINRKRSAWARARRRVLQERIAALGGEMRSLFSVT